MGLVEPNYREDQSMFHLLGFVSGGAISWLDHLRWDFAMSTSLFQSEWCVLW